jgi:hypothetical protein
MKKFALSAVKAAVLIEIFSGCVGASGTDSQTKAGKAKKYAVRKTKVGSIYLSKHSKF